MVFASEADQIEHKLSLKPIVSITDHDTLAAPLSLRCQPDPIPAPLSVEWTIPFAGNSFHVGVHHLPPACAEEVMKELSIYTAGSDESRLSDLLALLDSFPQVLLVLNHPWANFAWVDKETHRRTLLDFLAKYRSWIHALEFNGIRPCSENRRALELAEQNDLPVVGGGDRHGCRPCTVLNLTRTREWGEYVEQVRHDRTNDVLVMRTYEEPVQLRKLAVAGDVLRHYPHYPEGRRRFTDRIFASLDGDGWHSLTHHWGQTSPPTWVWPAVKATVGLASDHVRPILAWLFSLRGGAQELAAWPMADISPRDAATPSSRASAPGGLT